MGWIQTVDVHAEGEPSRVLLGSHLQVRGATATERLRYCEEHLHPLRRLLLREPRGYPGLCGVLVLPPSHPEADVGLVVLEQGGFRAMSGSNLICAVTALIETRAIPVTEPVTTVRIDTAAGLVRAEASVHGGKARSVTFANVPCYAAALDHVLDLPEYGKVPVDIVFGGQFFVQARAADLGVDLHPGAVGSLLRAGTVLRTVAQRDFPVRHPVNPQIDGISLAMITGPADTPGVSGRNTVVMPNGPADLADPATWTGVLDRSPCGTGTSGRMAALHARGELAPGESFVHESLLGTTFTGSITQETTVGPHRAILPTITGRAWVTGFGHYVLDDTDPFPEGYTLGDIWGPPDTDTDTDTDTGRLP
ncbi:proline racemase family protein [Amycolatopsis lurida]